MNLQNYPDIFEPFENLVEINVLGERYAVPENNNLLRCFQFLAMHTVSRGEFCWNGDCANCQFWFDDDGKEKIALACRTKVSEGLTIKRMSRELKIVMSDE